MDSKQGSLSGLPSADFLIIIRQLPNVCSLSTYRPVSLGLSARGTIIEMSV